MATMTLAGSGKTRGQTDLSTARILILPIPHLQLGTDSSVPAFFRCLLAARSGAEPLRAALANHWPEYLMEAAGLGIFMLSACAFGVLLEHPMSPVNGMIENPFARRVLMGIAMG